MALNDEHQEKISQLQMLEGSMQKLNQQKQHLHSKILEIDSALKELSGSEESYKIIGNIMVKTDADTLSKELTEQKSTQEVRIKAIEKQESSLREKAKKLQEEVMSAMEKKND